MKTRLNILSISIVMLFTMALSVVPHHHHQQKVCVIMELSIDDCSHSEQHSICDMAEENSEHNERCTIGTQYISSINSLKVNSISDSGDEQSITDYFCLLTSYFIYSADASIAQTIDDRNIVGYESALLDLSSGLRGPPYSLS